MKIVLGGSRHLEYIPNEVAEKIDEWISKSVQFLVGDAPGSDRAFQSLLQKRKYPNVLILSSAGLIRNNLGNWPTELVESGLKSKSHAIHAFKDRKMTAESDFGLMVWDCKSAGTLSNVIDLIGQGKNCFIWVAPDSELDQFDNQASLDKWMANYSEVRDEASKRLSTFHKREVKRVSDESQPELFG